MKKLFQIFCLILTTGLFAQTNFIENKTPSTKRVILLDAGHGGTDTGVKKDEFQEKDIALKIAEIIQQKNPFTDVDFVLLRKGDEQIINTSRAKMINEIKHSDFTSYNRHIRIGKEFIDNYLHKKIKNIKI